MVTQEDDEILSNFKHLLHCIHKCLLLLLLSLLSSIYVSPVCAIGHMPILTSPQRIDVIFLVATLGPSQ